MPHSSTARSTTTVQTSQSWMGATLRTGTAGSQDESPCRAIHKFKCEEAARRLSTGRQALCVFGGVGLGLGDGFAFVEAGVVVEGGEGAGLHAVNVEGAVEVIDFVLEDAGVPAGGLDELGLGALVEVFHADGAGAGDDGGETGEAEAAFVEIFHFVARVDDHGIDDDVKRDGAALAFGEIVRGIAFQQVFAVFDHGELQGLADLRGGETDAGRFTHGVAHIVNEALDFFAENFLRREEAGRFAQNRFARLENFQTHAISFLR